MEDVKNDVEHGCSYLRPQRWYELLPRKQDGLVASGRHGLTSRIILKGAASLAAPHPAFLQARPRLRPRGVGRWGRQICARS